MAKFLLDTHAFLWWLDGSRKLPLPIRRTLSKAASVTYVSAATAWEIATKARLGRIPSAVDVAADVSGAVAREGFLALPITLAHGERAGSLPEPLRDPFDRILIAQSMIESLPLVSADEAFDAYGVRRLWS